MKQRRRKERALESRRPNLAAWPRAALPIRGKTESLDRCIFLHLFAADGARVLVAMVLLDCSCARRRTNFTHVASVGRTDFLLCGDAHVFDVVAANAHNRKRQTVVALAKPLHPE